jgi:hypothetical protein
MIASALSLRPVYNTDASAYRFNPAYPTPTPAPTTLRFSRYGELPELPSYGDPVLVPAD